MRVDLHNHTALCNHANGSIEEFIKRAIELKIDIFGFSDHAPMEFDKKHRMKFDDIEIYESNIRYFKNKYKNDIEILLGYEVDFLDGYIEEDIIEADVDYLIGSVHFINEWGFDNPAFIGEYKNKDIDKIYEDYFYQIELMAKSRLFDIVGHFDLIKVFNFLPKKDIRVLAKNAIEAIKDAGMSIEVNSAGFRKPIKEQYPSSSLLNICYEEEIPITIGSDAHKVEDIGFKYEESISLIKDIGYKEVLIYRDREPIAVSI